MDDRFDDKFGLKEEREEGLSTAALAGVGERNVRGGAGVEAAPSAAVAEEESAPLLAEGEVRDLRGRWDMIQAAFVDQPREAVQEADKLVASAMKRLAEMFAEERSKLEGQWDRGDNVSTEDLRVALRRYRSFFNRLLSM